MADLARRRVTAPATPVGIIFKNASSDYGVMDNLEGDAGGYLVACGSSPSRRTKLGRGAASPMHQKYL